MQWKGDKRNEPVPDWSCNPVSTRRKPCAASHIQLCNIAYTGIFRILSVCSIEISRWWNIERHGRPLTSFSHLKRCFLPGASQHKGVGQSQCPENRTREEAKGRWRNNWWNLDAVQEVVQNEFLVGLYQPRDSCFQGVRCRLQASEDRLDVSLGWTDSSIQSLVTEFCWETWRST